MTDQQQPQPQFSIAELGAKFGIQIGQANAEIITLEKIRDSQQQEIRELAKKIVRLTGDVEDLENDLALLRSEIFDLQQTEEARRIKIAILETMEIESDNKLLPSAELAQQGTTIISGDKEA